VKVSMMKFKESSSKKFLAKESKSLKREESEKEFLI